MRTPSEAVLPTVRADHPRPPQAGQDGRGLGIEAGLAAPECRVERTLADRQAEQLEQQPAQPTVADVVDEAQIHRQRHDGVAERRARLQPFRQRGQGGAAATAAVPGIALDPRHHRRDLRQVHLVEAGRERQVGLGQRCLAMRAAGRAGGDGLIRRLGEPPTTTLATEAALAGIGPARLGLAVRLLAPRRRQAGVVRRLRRNAEPGFQLHNPRRQRRDLSRQRLHLRPERMNERILLVMREQRQVG
jgi:hypothetical protein